MKTKMKAKMKAKRTDASQEQIFSHPVRRLNADELKKVVGSEFSARFHGKCCGGMDNQGREF
jgi:hypothetical protein